MALRKGKSERGVEKERKERVLREEVFIQSGVEWGIKQAGYKIHQYIHFFSWGQQGSNTSHTSIYFIMQYHDMVFELEGDDPFMRCVSAIDLD